MVYPSVNEDGRAFILTTSILCNRSQNNRFALRRQQIAAAEAIIAEHVRILSPLCRVEGKRFSRTAERLRIAYSSLLTLEL